MTNQPIGMKDQFRTEIKLKKGEFPEISYQSSVGLIGSCFSDEIGEKFHKFKFKNLSNPFGVTYNPVSMAEQIRRICQKKHFNEADLFRKGQGFNSYELHGSFDREDSSDLIEELALNIDRTYDFLRSASHLFITLGTAWIYELKSDGRLVNNCHKQPSSIFNKRLLSLLEIEEACLSMVNDCHAINKELKVIFTISPVRHLKDGFTENSLGKSLLRVALNRDELRKKASYFPSYEMMNDDLRDYRFYASDMIHPNEIAVNYIWEQLISAQMSEQTVLKMKAIEKIQHALGHKAFNVKSAAHQSFLKETINTCQSIRKSNPEIDLEKEIQELTRRLTE